MNNDIDLTTAKMANKKYDLEKLKRKSINQEKILIHGESYRSKRIDRRHIKKVGLLVAGMLAMLVANRSLNRAEVLDTYERVLNNKVQSELSYTESIEFLESHQPTNRQISENYVEAVHNLDEEDYDFFGNRKDGSHNETMPIDLDSLVSLSDKQKDAIDTLTDDEIEEFKRGK